MQEQTCQDSALDMADADEAVKWATKVAKSKPPRYTDASRNAARYILSIAAMPDTNALEAADRLADQLEDGINYYDAPQLLRDALHDYRAARANKP